MLRRLVIRNFVIVDCLELEFSSGFGALTGETGAGKSILLDALGLALGGRAEAGVVRHGTDRADVIAEFDALNHAGLSTWLEEQAISVEDGALILRRVVEVNGRSKAWVNGVPVTLGLLREVGEHLADIHGQHAHHALLRPEIQRSVLDVGAEPLASAVAQAYRTWRNVAQVFERAQQDHQGLAREREHLACQVDELQALAFELSDWQAGEQEQKRLAHAAHLMEGASEAASALGEREGAACAQLQTWAQRVRELSSIDQSLNEVVDLLDSAAIQAEEARHALERYRDRIDLDPGRLEEIEKRMTAVMSIARKYRVPPEELPALLDKSEKALAELVSGTAPEQLAVQLEQARLRYEEAAQALTKHRQTMAVNLSARVTERMQQLAMPGGRFEIALVPRAAPAVYGQEDVEFLVSANSGQALRALNKVASGGELSRIGLAIQVISSSDSATPTLIFDEVDTGIGGGVAEIVGRLLHELGQTRQVLCVTHLPQVAAQADWQWRIAKVQSEGQAVSRVDVLDAAERIEEIARMLGGVEMTATTRQHAQEMLSKS